MFAFPLLLAVVVSAPADSTVVLPLAEYERLRQGDAPASEGDAATVVEEIHVQGSLRKDTLQISFGGRSVGKRASVPVLSPSGSGAEPRLGRCEGQALLQRTPDGHLFLTPLAEQFVLKCRLFGDGHPLQLTVPASVLDLEADVKDAEVRHGDTDGGRTLFLGIPPSPAVTETLRAEPPSVVQARYQLSLGNQETRFRYLLQVHNDADGMAPLQLRLAGSERLDRSEPESERTPDGALRLHVPPGDSSVVLAGKLTASRFVPPLPQTVQYLLLENDPLLRVEVKTLARHISASETGLTPSGPGALGFLLRDTPDVTWTATPLQAFAATRYAIASAQHTFFLGDDGRALAESRIQLENRGVSALSLPMSGQPIFASLQGEPRALTHDDSGDLWIPLVAGPQELVVQQRQGFWHDWALASGTLELPRLGAPATDGTVELRYSDAWVPLYESLGGDRRAALPRAEDVAVFLSWLLWTERLCFAFGMQRGRRALLSSLASLAAVVSGPAHFALLSFDSVATALWVIPFLRRSSVLRGLKLQWVVLAVALGVMGTVTLFGDPLRRMFGNAADSLGGNTAMSYSYAPSAAKASKGLAGFGTAPEPEPAYQGIAVQTQLPQTERRTVFVRQLLDTATPVAARVVLLSSSALLGLEALLIACALAAVVLSRAQLLQGIREALRRAVGEAMTP